MENQTAKKFYGLDHLRTLAILWVVLFHYFILSQGEPAWLVDWAGFGWTGVDLFFVLSGFLISAQLFEQIKLRQSFSWKDFFIKRFFRIIPAYWVTLLLYFAFAFFREKEQLPPLWKFLTFTQNLGLNLKDYGTFSHAWSLCVEEHFYFFLPLILLYLLRVQWFKKAYFLLLGLFLLGFAIRLYNYDVLYLPKMSDDSNWMYWYQYIYYPTYNRLDGLLVGVSIAAVYVFWPQLWQKLSAYGNHFIVASLVVLTAAYFLCEDQMTFAASIFGFPLIAIGYGFLVMSAISPSSFLYRWNSKGTTFIATISYALYLTHKGIIHITHLVLKDFHLNANVLLLMSLCTSIGFAYLMHIVVEKPFMKWRHKLMAQKRD